ncbi:hypothetical protein [Streptomyces oceani]|uniref:hypothetical protein n=1 Tax=Streptomyces oceani TaxID=1075402 RepID=UPI000871F3AF|nr:hypothetical protein [Streptomyces oceani]
MRNSVFTMVGILTAAVFTGGGGAASSEAVTQGASPGTLVTGHSVTRDGTDSGEGPNVVPVLGGEGPNVVPVLGGEGPNVVPVLGGEGPNVVASSSVMV